jgi:hypothetical protein
LQKFACDFLHVLWRLFLGDTTLRRLEADDPQVGGVLVTLPSGRGIELIWLYPIKHPDPVAAGKDLAARILDPLLREGSADVGAVNWASVAAACSRIVADWGSKLENQG